MKESPKHDNFSRRECTTLSKTEAKLKKSKAVVYRKYFQNNFNARDNYIQRRYARVVNHLVRLNSKLIQ